MLMTAVLHIVDRLWEALWGQHRAHQHSVLAGSDVPESWNSLSNPSCSLVVCGQDVRGCVRTVLSQFAIRSSRCLLLLLVMHLSA